jgi:hypothetical protein
MCRWSFGNNGVTLDVNRLTAADHTTHPGTRHQLASQSDRLDGHHAKSLAAMLALARQA